MTEFVGFGPEAVHRVGSPELAERHREELAAQLVDGRAVVVLGVGAGEGLELFVNACGSVRGLECDLAEAAATHQRWSERGVQIDAEDPLAWALRVDPSTLDAVVCLDVTRAVEPALAPELLRALGRLAAADVAMVVGIPVSTAPAGEPLPIGAWSSRAAQLALEELGAANGALFAQLPAEGSVFVRPGDEPAATAGMRWAERADPDVGGHLLAALHLAIPAELPAELQAAAAPADQLTVHALKDANRALRRANTALTRDAFARSGAAAAAALARRDLEIARLTAENISLRGEIDGLRAALAAAQAAAD